MIGREKKLILKGLQCFRNRYIMFTIIIHVCIYYILLLHAAPPLLTMCRYNILYECVCCTYITSKPENQYHNKVYTHSKYTYTYIYTNDVCFICILYTPGGVGWCVWCGVVTRNKYFIHITYIKCIFLSETSREQRKSEK